MNEKQINEFAAVSLIDTRLRSPDLTWPGPDDVVMRPIDINRSPEFPSTDQQSQSK